MKTFSTPKLPVFLLVLALARPGMGQEGPVAPPPFDGTEAFGHILAVNGLQPITNPTAIDPANTLIIIFGNLNELNRWPKLSENGLSQFLKEGGALLIATDYKGYRFPFPFVCPGNLVKAHGASAYKGYAQCPLIESWIDPAHPIYNGLKKGLATNHPSYLLPRGLALERLAEFPKDCSADDPGVLPDEAGYVFASHKGFPPSGRTLLLAGQGVFLNGMLIQEDNDNLHFALNCIDWLTQRQDGRRQFALFIDRGQVARSFALPLNQIGSLGIPPIKVINRTIRGIEDENWLNRLILERVGRQPILRGLLLIASALILILVAHKIRKARWRLDTKAPLIVGTGVAAPTMPSLLEQKQEELRRQGNLWEPAQVLARQFFLDHAAQSVPLWDQESPSRPTVHVQGNLWQRRSLQRLVANLWGLAHSSPAHRVTPKQFDTLMRELNTAGAAIRDGRLRFVN